jgi:LacI family transcriptional regulator
VFEAAATAAGAEIQTGPAWRGNYSASGGAQVIESLLDRGGELPRAIVCANDQTALGVIHTLARRGLNVPGDVAVTGFDDVPVARHLHPSLTTVRQPIEQMGATAFDVLYSMISGTGSDPNVVLPVRLMLRESCGCPHAPASLETALLAARA